MCTQHVAVHSRPACCSAQQAWSLGTCLSAGSHVRTLTTWCLLLLPPANSSSRITHLSALAGMRTHIALSIPSSQPLVHHAAQVSCLSAWQPATSLEVSNLCIEKQTQASDLRPADQLLLGR